MFYPSIRGAFMLFNSLDYLFFFIIVFTFYYILPKKVRYLWLLLTSYYFYGNWNHKYCLLILGITAVSYIAALFLEQLHSPPSVAKRDCLDYMSVLPGVAGLF